MYTACFSQTWQQLVNNSQVRMYTACFSQTARPGNSWSTTPSQVRKANYFKKVSMLLQSSTIELGNVCKVGGAAFLSASAVPGLPARHVGMSRYPAVTESAEPVFRAVVMSRRYRVCRACVQSCCDVPLCYTVCRACVQSCCDVPPLQSLQSLCSELL